MSNKQNPYVSPNKKLESSSLTQASSYIQSLIDHRRINRLQFINYLLGTFFIGLVIVFFLISIPVVGNLLSYFVIIAIYVLMLYITVKRLHDVKIQTWLAVVLYLFLPVLVAIIFFLVPGNKGPNDFGEAPPENSTAIVISATILMVLYCLCLASFSLFFIVGSV